jgi:hypothetical protein
VVVHAGGEQQHPIDPSASVAVDTRGEPRAGRSGKESAKSWEETDVDLMLGIGDQFSLLL